MKILTKINREKLLKNGRAHDEMAQGLKEVDLDPMPVVKLFTPWANCTWLLTELVPNHPHRAFGLCDLGMGSPELGYVNLSELLAVKGPAGLSVERDRWFKADMPLSAYAEAARNDGHIKA